MPDSIRALIDGSGVPYQLAVPMAEHTTLKVGGPADLWIDARSADDIAISLAAARETRARLLVIGQGSNLLVRDGGIREPVLHIGGRMAQVSREGNTLKVGAGARLGQAAAIAQQAGLSGMEPVSGIPGTMGGAVAMNAGSYGTEIGEMVEQVHAVDPDGHLHRLSPGDIAFRYRGSSLLDTGWIVTGVTLRLSPGDPDRIAAKRREYAGKRRQMQPLSLPSAGSFFKRPDGFYAGRLVDQAGLKGVSVGGAQVSTLHAGFFVNTGGATAADFLALMALVTARVKDQFGITLEPEVRILGCDTSC